ncbi:hypothetical protein SAMN05444161_4100 [Rhizobiales bacterium GAS191]|nr:hypothetical protein SAMN05519103_03393 [Rhizobiales bacterium GAS113]SED82004.1 hypothetical protein SAMN05444161_4100 [Rhizobiales bacterium GAS191]SEE63477.1 hypothetical protein SAMN05519104_6820 [Rhizobiales bacterium GAS188]
MSGERWKKWMLISAGIMTLVAIGGFVAIVLIMGSPSHRGATRSAPHSTTD